MMEIFVRNSVLMESGAVFGAVFSAAYPYREEKEVGEQCNVASVFC